MKRFVVACALAFVPALAAADPQTPEEWYKEGENQYNLGNFDAAVKAFKEGFSREPVESKKAVYLYNIAQSYRQAKNCSEAQFFYKRFLALKDNDTARPLAAPIRKEVEDRIKELEECARQQEAIKNRPPDVQIKPDEDPNKTKPVDDPNKDPKKVGIGTPEDEEEEEEPEKVEDGITGQPTKVSARLIGGGSKISMGDVTVPLQATFGVTGGYPIPLNEKLTVEAGLGLRFTRVSWDAMATTGKTGTATLTAVMANGAVTYDVAPKMAVRGDLGLGLLFFGGTSGSPFTGGAETEGGALAMFHLRAGGAFDYAITPNIVATVPLAFSFSPKKEGVAAAIVSFDFMVGIGYRM
jgi:tetratricopeptide (TPR) repeat protein